MGSLAYADVHMQTRDKYCIFAHFKPVLVLFLCENAQITVLLKHFLCEVEAETACSDITVAAP
jgi:hypothetical protein